MIFDNMFKQLIFAKTGYELQHLNVNTMQTITIELTGNNSLKALQDLEHKHLIRILKDPDLNSYSLPGEPISNEDFRKWVEYAENCQRCCHGSHL